MKNHRPYLLLFLMTPLFFSSCLDWFPEPDTKITQSDTVFVNFNDAGTIVKNTLISSGVAVSISNSDVVVHSTNTDRTVCYVLSGNTTNGMFKIYSEKSYHLLLNGVSITNPDGPAINNQCSKNIQLILCEGTTNNLADGTTYAAAIDSNGIAEDQKATFFNEGKVHISGNGKLSISGNGADQHAFSSDDYIELLSGEVEITQSAKDGINCNDGFFMSGGKLTVSSNSDGIDAGTGSVRMTGGAIVVHSSTPDVDAICTDSLMEISGGTVTLDVAGDRSKGLKSAGDMLLSGGTIAVNASGNVVLIPVKLGTDPSYCSGIKCDGNLQITNTNLTIAHSGIAGKCISVSGNLEINSGTLQLSTTGNGGLYTDSTGVQDAYSAACISTKGTTQLLGGNTTATSTGSGGKGLSSDKELTIGNTTGSPRITVSTSGGSVLSGSTSMTESKAIKSDANIVITNGTILVNATGTGEAMDTKASILMSGGTVVLQGSAVTSTRVVDYSSAFTISGGTFAASGPYRSKNISIPGSASTQRFLYAKLSTATTLAAGTLFHIQNAAGDNILTYKPARAAYYLIYSSPSVVANTAYSIYTGGTTTGNELNGLYTDGVYSGGSLKGSFATTSNNTTFTN